MTALAATVAAPAGAGAPTPGTDANIADVRILSINDFHGQLTDSTSKVGDVEIGGAATLAAYVQRERAGNPNGTVFVAAGDLVGAAQPESTLLQHQSTIAVLDQMGLDLTTFGNHEFDKGYAQAIRMIYGDAALSAAEARQGIAPPKKGRRRTGANAVVGAKSGAAHVAAAKGRPAWPGSPFAWVNANVVDTKTKKPILPPFTIRVVNGVKIGFIGATTADLKNVTVAKGIPNVTALDPVAAINRYVPAMKAAGAKTIVVMIHEGGTPAKGSTTEISGPIVDIAKGLDPAVGAIISGHSHTEYATEIAGKQVVQAGSYAKALAEVDLKVDRTTGKVVGGSSRLIRNDEHGIQPDAKVGAMVKTFHAAVAPRTEKVITELKAPLTRTRSAAGETLLGGVIADAQRDFAKADFAFMNPGGIRQDLPTAGKLTWGTIFGVQPFANRVMKLELTGAEVQAMLEQQFEGPEPRVLQVSGLTVHLDLTKPVGSRIASVVLPDGSKLDPKQTYSVAANSFIADGGDGFTVLKKGRKRQDIGVDLDALVAWFAKSKDLPTETPGRIVLDAGALPADAH
ncbi:MAG: bifunctional metallophosphatase/5-nucleotidase [Thermoleophilia bacterium]|nr:bifunctional metallophosphatase/5-nucleotidase [Thermoleophilia bacterium]